MINTLDILADTAPRDPRADLARPDRPEKDASFGALLKTHEKDESPPAYAEDTADTREQTAKAEDATQNQRVRKEASPQAQQNSDHADDPATKSEPYASAQSVEESKTATDQEEADAQIEPANTDAPTGQTAPNNEPADKPVSAIKTGQQQAELDQKEKARQLAVHPGSDQKLASESEDSNVSPAAAAGSEHTAQPPTDIAVRETVDVKITIDKPEGAADGKGNTTDLEQTQTVAPQAEVTPALDATPMPPVENPSSVQISEEPEPSETEKAVTVQVNPGTKTVVNRTALDKIDAPVSTSAASVEVASTNAPSETAPAPAQTEAQLDTPQKPATSPDALRPSDKTQDLPIKPGLANPEALKQVAALPDKEAAQKPAQPQDQLTRLDRQPAAIPTDAANDQANRQKNVGDRNGNAASIPKDGDAKTAADAIPLQDGNAQSKNNTQSDHNQKSNAQSSSAQGHKTAQSAQAQPVTTHDQTTAKTPDTDFNPKLPVAQRGETPAPSTPPTLQISLTNPDLAQSSAYARPDATLPGAAAPNAQPKLTPQNSQLLQTQLAFHIARQFSNGVTKFDIRLDPPELGRINVQLQVAKDGHLKATLSADKKDTLDLLQRDQRLLQKSLNDAGLDLDTEDFAFSLNDNGTGANTGNPYSQAGNWKAATDLPADSALPVTPKLDISEIADTYGFKTMQSVRLNLTA